MATFKIKLTFEDLQCNGVSIRGTAEYDNATIGDIHAGSTFDGTITMNGDAAYDFIDMIDNDLQIIFWVTGDDD